MTSLDHTLRSGIARGVGIVGLAGIGLIHLLDAIGKFSETPYIAWMYVGLILGTIVAAALLLNEGSRRAWALTGGLAASAVVGYCLSRTVGLPNATGDIGNWKEPLGLASLFVEGCVVVLSGYGLALAGRRQTAPARAELRREPVPA